MTESNRQWDLALDRTGSAGPAALRVSVVFAVLVVVATIAVVFHRQEQLTVYPQFTTFHAGFVFIVDGIVAFLLFGQFVYRPLVSYAILGTAYLFNALVVIPFLFSFPGALKAEGGVIGGSQSSVWVWHAWHIVFPLIIILSLLAHERANGRMVALTRVVPYLALAVGTAVMLAALVAVAVTVFHDHLPVLITTDRMPLSSGFYVASGIAVAVTACALALALWVARRRSLLHVWLAVALTIFLGDAVAGLMSTGRYTLAWYFGRVESMIAAAVLLLVFLGEINHLYRRLARTIGDLSAFNRKLAALVQEKETLVAELRHREEEIRQLAHFDPVTELPNRRLLMDRLSHVLAQAARHGHTTALLFLDLGKFKEVNDQLGHDAGDKLLHEVGARLSRCVRSGDTVSRLGGDEFVIVLPEVSPPDDVEATADKILRILGEPIALDGHSLSITTSIGIALAKPGAPLDGAQLLTQADTAMYAAKRAGRNQYAFAA